MNAPEQSAAVAAGTTARYAWYVTVLLAVAYFVSYVDRIVLALLVEPIKQDLQVSDTAMSLLLGLAFALFYAALGIPIARLADRYSRKWIIVGGIALWSLMTTLTGIARSYAGILIARMGVGVGEAALTPAAYSMLADYFKPAALTRPMSVYHMGAVVGIGAAFIVGGAVAELARSVPAIALPLIGPLKSWQLAFFIVGVPGLLLAGLMALTMREPARTDRQLGSTGRSSSMREVLGFMWRRRRAYACVILGPSVCGAYTFGTFSWMPTYLIRVFDASPGEAGLWFGLAVIVSSTGGFYASASVAAWLQKRGHSDALLRGAGYALLLSAAPTAFAYSLDEPRAVLAVWAVGAFLCSMPFVLCPTALQLITPSPYRATVSSIYLLATSMAGIAAGPTAVALLSEHVFGSPLALGRAMAIVAALALPAAGLICLAGRRSLVAALSPRANATGSPAVERAAT